MSSENAPSDALAGFKKPTQEQIEKLIAIVGRPYALTDPRDIEPYEHEPRDKYVGKTPLVLRPGTPEEVAAILRLASDEAIAIVPQGGNTGLVGGQVPFEGGQEVILSLTRLNRVRAVDPAGNTITVEAGVTLQSTQEAAAAVNRLFPLSLAAEGTATIGGNLASNAGGVHVLHYGNARDLTLGVEVVLADGRIWKGLKALRKDNTGYDLKNLMIGSEGTLGVITAATLKLFPRPAETAVTFAALPSVEAAAELFSFASEKAGPLLTAFEIMSSIGLDFVLRHGADTRKPLEGSHPWYALIELSSPLGGGMAQELGLTILEEAMQRDLLSDAALAASEGQAKDFWRLRELMSEVQKQEGGSIKHDISVPISAIPAFLHQADAAIERFLPGARPVAFGHFGDGNIHYNVSQPVSMDKAAYLSRWEEMQATVHEIALSFGGSVSAEHGVGRMKAHEILQIKSEPELDLMRRIKSALDPKGILNPGKVIVFK